MTRNFRSKSTMEEAIENLNKTKDTYNNKQISLKLNQL